MPVQIGEQAVVANAGLPQPDAASQAEDPGKPLIEKDLLRLRQIEAQDRGGEDEGVAADRQQSAKPGVPDFYSNAQEYVATNKYWSSAFAADRAAWVDRLDEVFDRPDDSPSIEGESDLALRAVLGHPGYSYTPALTLSSLTAECRNLVCKVEVAPEHKSELVFDIGRRNPDTGLTPLDTVLFAHNFGHHVSRFNPATGIRTHYLLVNGFNF